MRSTSQAIFLRLLSAFELRVDGRRVTPPAGTRRLVALLALHDRPLQRCYAAGTLWPEVDEERAAANLRTALWRLHRCIPLVTRHGDEIALHSRVRVDLHEAKLACRLVAQTDIASSRLRSVEAILECGDLLPGWYEDWVAIEREKFRQLRLHALETACEELTTLRMYANAIQVGLAAVAAEPLRETAHAMLIKAFVAEGNLGEAARQFKRYASLMRDELGIGPSRELAALVGPLAPPARQSCPSPRRPSSAPDASSATTASTGIPIGTRTA